MCLHLHTHSYTHVHTHVQSTWHSCMYPCTQLHTYSHTHTISQWHLGIHTVPHIVTELHTHSWRLNVLELVVSESSSMSLQHTQERNVYPTAASHWTRTECVLRIKQEAYDPMPPFLLSLIHSPSQPLVESHNPFVAGEEIFETYVQKLFEGVRSMLGKKNSVLTGRKVGWSKVFFLRLR